ncbi:hypothetical protein G7068_16310 [Leucobacter viscericola]|uniref:Uncharacterized protein n=1 Tax=Leucobacter viscericola TaxID=2714935 RepID=A0A6G7XJR5_9MICO|nr:hypothetical protein [Leucobacter viscericola]QIK64611.1 hypothetical protein G7068_16310 [Leucobacter viscericola]
MNAKSDKNQSRTVHGMFARVNGVVAAFALIGAVGLTVTLSAASLPEVDPVKVEAVEIAETPEAPQIDVRRLTRPRPSKSRHRPFQCQRWSPRLSRLR